MSKRSPTIAACVNTFVESVLKYGEFMLVNHKVANKHYGKYTRALKELSLLGDAGMSALAKLMDDERRIIRVMAACYAVHFRTEKALRVLNSATGVQHGVIGMLATVTLKRWELGRYMDPKTGKEALLVSGSAASNLPQDP